MKFDASIVQKRTTGPLGPMVLGATARGLAGVWFTDQKHLPDMADWSDAAAKSAALALLQKAEAQLADYFAGKPARNGRHFDLPLDLSAGTDFQQAVWQALLKIPTGSTTSYGALAASIGKPAAVRALGAAVGRNPIGIIVPCHRVLGMDGSLTGYAGGLPRKVALLQLEGVLI